MIGRPGVREGRRGREKMQGSNLGRMLLQPTSLGWADGRVMIGIPPGSYPAQAEPTNTPTAGEGTREQLELTNLITMLLLSTLHSQLSGYLPSPNVSFRSSVQPAIAMV